MCPNTRARGGKKKSSCNAICLCQSFGGNCACSLFDRCVVVSIKSYNHYYYYLADLSFQAAQRVMSSDPQRALKVLRDISQDLPMQTRFV